MNKRLLSPVFVGLTMRALLLAAAICVPLPDRVALTGDTVNWVSYLIDGPGMSTLQARSTTDRRQRLPREGASIGAKGVFIVPILGLKTYGATGLDRQCRPVRFPQAPGFGSVGQPSRAWPGKGSRMRQSR